MNYWGTFSLEYTYAPTSLHERCLRGGENKRIPNTFKEAMRLPEAAHKKEAADKGNLSLGKHGVYELVPISLVSSSQKVVGTRWVNKIKQMIRSKVVCSCRRGLKFPVLIMVALSLRSAGCKVFALLC